MIYSRSSKSTEIALHITRCRNKEFLAAEIDGNDNNVPPSNDQNIKEVRKGSEADNNGFNTAGLFWFGP